MNALKVLVPVHHHQHVAVLVQHRHVFFHWGSLVARPGSLGGVDFEFDTPVQHHHNQRPIKVTPAEVLGLRRKFPQRLENAVPNPLRHLFDQHIGP